MYGRKILTNGLKLNDTKYKKTKSYLIAYRLIDYNLYLIDYRGTRSILYES